MSERPPRVSIGVPVYNGEDFLEEALTSLLTQTFTDFELIISDNGSTDGTEAICLAYAARDSRISYHRSARNRGGAWNRNHCFALSRGEFFMWHDHDDRSEPTLLARCVAVLDADPCAVLCHANTIIIDEHGQQLRAYVEGVDLRSSSPYRRLRDYLRHGLYCPLCSLYFSLIRRDILAETPLMGAYVNAELSLMSELALRGTFREIPEHLFYRRDHPGISTRKYATPEERIVWSNPARVGKGGGDGWWMLYAQLRSYHVVPMRAVERARCFWIALAMFGYLAQGSLRKWTAQLRRRLSLR